MASFGGERYLMLALPSLRPLFSSLRDSVSGMTVLNTSIEFMV